MGWVDILRRGRAAVPSHSWSVFGHKTKIRSIQPMDMLQVVKFSHLNLVQTHVRLSKYQSQLLRWGAIVAITSATYQFVTNLHTVPISGRTQVVVLTREEERELGQKAAQEELAGAKVINDGPQWQLCLDVATRLVAVSEHLFPRKYDWELWLVDNPLSANACCAPGGKIIIETGILNLINVAVEKGICHNKYDALAVVMAHEIGHALARHTAEVMSMLPLLYIQLILGMESPLLKYIFQFAFNLPFSRSQETEADHIGIMLLASACYDPSEAPRLWKAFSELNKDPDADIELDWLSTHPSNRKREKALEKLVDAALEVQRRSSWCAFLQKKVLEAVGVDTKAGLLHHIRATMTQVYDENVRIKSENTVRRRDTIDAIHGLESEEMLKVIQSTATAARNEQTIE